MQIKPHAVFAKHLRLAELCTMLVFAVTVVLCLLSNPAEAIVSDEVFDNCEFLGEENLQVFWTVRADDSAIDFQLCGCASNVTTNEYMGFGLSGATDRTLMRGADVTIAYVDDDTGPIAIDYFLSEYVQCREGVGVCPDTFDSSGTCTDDVSDVSGFKREGLQCVTFTRSYSTSDSTCDIAFDPDNEDQYIVWAVGGVGETAFKHFRRGEGTDDPIHIGRNPADRCIGGLRCPNCPNFKENTMDATGRNETFVANIGPPGNERGYMAITDQASWGIAWYINDTLIPAITVERGYTYTFVSNGGLEGDGENYHPFYLTNSKRGGRLANSQAQQLSEIVYAGFDEDGNPLGVGPYCEIVESIEANAILNTCGPQEDYVANLVKEECTSEGTPGRFTWTPDETTPSVVYYQCATHLNLGYKIIVSGAPRVAPYATSLVLMTLLTITLIMK